MEYKDYYGTLDVARDASQEEIQRSYRKLARKYHPDVNKEPAAEAKFKEISEAYEVLKDPEKRSKYDRFGSAWKQAQQTGAPPPGYEDIFSAFGGGGFGGAGRGGQRGAFEFGGEGFSSFFEMLFGGEPRARGGPGTAWGRGRSPFERGGADHEASIQLTLEEAAKGGQRELTLTDPMSGKRRKLRVKIPPGVRAGQKIRLSGQGGRGAGGGERGDLYLKVELRPHPDFQVEGYDLHTSLPVTPWEAVLGGTATLPTLEDKVTVKIPPGSSSGRRIRLRGRGLPKSDGSRGDLLAQVRIVVPSKPTEAEKKLFEKLAATSKFEAER